MAEDGTYYISPIIENFPLADVDSYYRFAGSVIAKALFDKIPIKLMLHRETIVSHLVQ